MNNELAKEAIIGLNKEKEMLTPFVACLNTYEATQSNRRIEKIDLQILSIINAAQIRSNDQE